MAAITAVKGPLLVVAAVIENVHGEVLIAKRPEHHKIAGGQWEFPGGKVEPGEDLRSCLMREIQEELGLEIHVGELVHVCSHVYHVGTRGLALDPAVHVVLVAYRARVEATSQAIGTNAPLIKLHDVAEVKWVSSVARPREDFAAGDIEIVNKIWPH